MRYDAVFLDVDGTLLWVDLDLEGYAADLSPYSENDLTAEVASGPVRESVRSHIKENIKYRTVEELNGFKRENAKKTASALGVKAPPDILAVVADRRISFKPYSESEAVLKELKDLGVPLYVVSNWDVLLEEVLDDLGWLGYFDGVIASAVVGSEKPDGFIFEEALRVSEVEPNRAVHVGNDVVADIKGAAGSGIDTVLIDRSGDAFAPAATFVFPDLKRLPELVRS
ncbi:MAG: HAD family hydrolase [Rubrobacteraceae bacterium]